MPKKTYIVDNWAGGLNSHGDINSLEDNELSVLQHMTAREGHKITMTGGLTSFTFKASSAAYDVTNVSMGYGLFYFSTDGNLYTHSTDTAPTNNIGLAIGGHNSTGDYIVQIFDKSGFLHTTTDSASYITINDISATSDTANNSKISYYYVDGGLRIVDSNFDNANSSNILFNKVKNSHFADATQSTTDTMTSYSFDGYYQRSSLVVPSHGMYGANIAAGTTTGASATVVVMSAGSILSDSAVTEMTGSNYICWGLANSSAALITSVSSSTTFGTDSISTNTWLGSTINIYPPAGTGYTIDIAELASSNGTITSGVYELGQTFIYDGLQETAVSLMTHSSTGNFQISTVGNVFTGRIFFTGGYDPSITGGRVYLKRINSEDEWSLILDIDFKKGARISRGLDYVQFNTQYKTSYSVGLDSGQFWDYKGAFTSFVIYDLNPETYNTINGFSPDDVITPRWKTAALTKRIAYVGNCLVDGDRFPDTIFKSHVNKFDTFTKNRKLDIVVSDGEDITKLETFADRILEFKQDTLYILNIANELEFLEDTYKGMGISQSYHSVQTEYGVVFINNLGIFLYNGEKIIDLFLDASQAKRKIKLSTYRLTMSGGLDKAAISYDRVSKKVLFHSRIDEPGVETDLWELDLISFTWAVLDQGIPDTSTKSNSITDWVGQSLYYDASNSGQLIRYSTGLVATNNAVITTPYYDFGDYSTDKILYKVIISHKAAGVSNVTVTYKDSETQTERALSSSGVFSNHTTVQEQEFTPMVDGEKRNKKAYSLNIKVESGGTIPTTFEVHQLRFIYRDKNDR